MTTPTALDRGRTAYREHRFADAVAGLDEADREHAVAASDLEQPRPSRPSCSDASRRASTR